MKKKFLVAYGILLLGMNVFAKSNYFAWDFSNSEIMDILFSVSVDTGISIVADDTVSGKSDFKFNGTNFEVAFDAFLENARLYVRKTGNLWTVSRFRYEKDKNGISIDAFDLLPVQILEKLSLEIGQSISFDVLPAQKISVHYRKLDEKNLIEALAKRFGNYDVEYSDGYLLVRKNEVKNLGISESYVKIERSNDEIFVNVKDANFRDVIEELFTKANSAGVKNQFCFLGNGNPKVSRCSFKGKTLQSVLESVCFQNGFSYQYENGIFYIYQNENTKQELIHGKKDWCRFDLKYTEPEKIISLLYSLYGKIETSLVDNSASFYAFVTGNQKIEIQKLIEDLDVKKSVYIVNLKYIKPDFFVNHLPPFIKKESVFIANNNSSIYFEGTAEEYAALCEQLTVCDRPETRINYDLLILQCEESEQFSWSNNFSTEALKMGDRNEIAAQLGSVLSLNMNVVSAFGLNFAANLQSALEKSKTNVFVDTKLRGISGKEINFQNTNTYRYRDNNLDPETGKPIYSGITKEIVSGIKLDVTGWVSGEGMISSSIVASISRQGLDTSASTGNPPPTSEKIIRTEVCGKAGEPVVITGLIENSSMEDTKNLPGLSKIPILGWLFKEKEKISGKSQTVIYLIPHIDSEIESAKNKKSEFNASVKLSELINILDESEVGHE